jgi:hypothetical protein
MCIDVKDPGLRKTIFFVINIIYLHKVIRKGFSDGLLTTGAVLQKVPGTYNLKKMGCIS